MNTSDKYIQANDINIHYEEYGSSVPLILLRGGTITLEEWQAHIPSFAPHFHVYVLDSRAHGKAENCQTAGLPTYSSSRVFNSL